MARTTLEDHLLKEIAQYIENELDLVACITTYDEGRIMLQFGDYLSLRLVGSRLIRDCGCERACQAKNVVDLANPEYMSEILKICDSCDCDMKWSE